MTIRSRTAPLRALWPAAACLALAAAVTCMALLLGVETCAPETAAGDKLASVLRSPAAAALNLLPPLALTVLGALLTRRMWAAYLCAAVPTLLLALANYWKVALRGDPLLFSDLRLARTAGGIVGRYRLPWSETAAQVLVLALLLLVLSACLPKLPPLPGRARLAALLAWLAAAPLVLGTCYLSDTVYKAIENDAFLEEHSDSELYAARGVCYSFLHTVPDALSAVPASYSRRNGARVLSAYAGADIPDGQKVQVVGVMLEAFCDLTDFPALRSHPGAASVYAPLHELESRGVSGDIFTGIFSGGTVESEWNFLTGYSHHDEFTAGVDSYVRYFDAQGYETVFSHPGYSWFYDRRLINGYLGFDRSVFSEDGFGDLVAPELAPYRSDGVLFDYLLGALDARTDADAPLFSFSVSYQNHGPYGDDLFDGALVTPENSGLSAESCGILSHYLYGVQNTIEELRRFTDALEARGEPVVAVFFGDHKPWLGNDKSVYRELGVNLDLATEEGFRNTYAMPYLIWANTAAKRALGRDFTGSGGDFSACLLMEELFDCCGWDGPAFMRLAREMRSRSPLLHWRGRFLVDGAFLSREELPRDVLDFYLDYCDAEYWREHHAPEVTEL